MNRFVLKFLLAFMLISGLTLGCFDFSYADDSRWNDEMADELYDLGLFKGRSTVQFIPGLKYETTSIEAITLIGRALKWDVDKNATSSFSDVPKWAVPYTEYAKNHGITSGVGDGMFGTRIDGRRMLSWMLAALGENKEDVWENTETYGEKYGIEIPQTALRNDVVYIIYEGLKHPRVGEEQSLMDGIKETFDKEIVETLPGLPKNFIFSAGAEGKRTVVTIKTDGSFEGESSYTDEGDVGIGYPNGTKHISKFYGEFENFHRLDEYAYSMNLKFIISKDIKEFEIKDNIRYVKSSPVGFDKTGKFLYFTPGKLKSKMPKEFIKWGSISWEFNAIRELTGYAFYNIDGDAGFFTLDN